MILLTLGYNFFQGIGSLVDKERSLYYYYKAAALGLDIAMINAGIMLETGDGVKADRIEARKYYEHSVSYDAY